MQGSHAKTAAMQAIEDAEAGQHVPGRVVLHDASVSIYLAVPEPLLVSALRNLLDNALRYSSGNSKVVLSIERLSTEDVLFQVLDEGPGLTQADCEQAVQRFWRRGTSSHGSGLGLSIVSEIARRFGGALLQSRVPRGLAAKLTLPSNARR